MACVPDADNQNTVLSRDQASRAPGEDLDTMTAYVNLKLTALLLQISET